MENKKIDITWGSVWKVFLICLFAIILYYTKETMVMIFTALVISSAIYSPVKYFEKRGIPRLISVLSIFLITILFLILILYLLIPVALTQFQYLLSSISSIKSPLFDALGATNILNQLQGETYNILKTIVSGGNSIVGIFSNILSSLFFILSAMVLSFYLAISKDGIEKFLKAIMPTDYEERAIKFYYNTRKKMEKWLGGQILLSLVVGSLTFIGLTIVGNKYAILLALLATVLELVPYVGPITVGIIAFLITLPQSFTSAIIVVLIFFIIQELENNLLVPLIMSKAVGTDPITIVIALIAGAQLAGIWGMLLAVPSVIIIEELIDDLSKKKHRKKVGS